MIQLCTTIGCLALLLLGMPLKGQEQKPTPEASQPRIIVWTPSDSVVKVQAQSDCVRSQFGSGVVIAPNVIATSAHGVQGCSQIQIHKDGRKFNVSHHILAVDLDLCLLRVPGLPCPSVPLFQGELPALGSSVQAIGFPGGQRLITTQGQVDALWKMRNATFIQSSAFILPGNSGGGLFTPDGQLLGLTTFVLSDMPTFNMSIPAQWILDLLDRPWENGQCIMMCKPSEIVMQDFIERMTEDPTNHKAWETFSRAWVAKNPLDANAWYSLGHTLTRRLQANAQSGLNEALSASAQEAYAKAAQLNPAHVRAWNNMGILYSLRGQYLDAIRTYQRALAIQPDYGLAWLNMASAYFDLREYASARKNYEKGLRLIPDDHKSRVALAYCEARNEMPEKAIQNLQIALRYSPLNLDAWEDLYAVCLKSKNKSLFKDLFKEFKKRLPESAQNIESKIRFE